jgi:serine protease Do
MRHRRNRNLTLVSSTVFALFVAACGGGSGDPSVATNAAPATDAAATTAVTEPATTVATTEAPTGNIDEVQQSVIQIEALGTIRSPEVGLTDGSGRGSGFIISADGLAVTNNHVVTGAATLEVFIGGDTTKSYNATVVGTSECSDLALIDIAEDEPLTPLTWYAGALKVGTEVYAAGFPLGETEYTLTRGIVSKLQAGGDTSWA